MLAILVLGAGGGVGIGIRGALARDHLLAAQATVAAAGLDLGTPSEAVERLARASPDTAMARSLTSDPVWEAATLLPWVGPQLAAVGSTASAVDDAVTGAAASLEAAASAMSPAALRPVDGVVDIARIAAAAPAAAEGATRLRAAAERVSAIDRTPLLGTLAEAVSSAAAQLEAAADAADAVQRATKLIPRMLGADGPRSTLVLFQNNAEWRSLGGVVGAVAQLDARDGRLSLTAQGSSADFVAFADDPVRALPDDVREIYDTRPARYMQNTTQVPDFAVGAAVARDMWERVHGAAVDSVLAVDPVALSYLLRATGPVTLPSGDQLTADDAVSLLLDQVYRRHADPRDQDAFFQTASASVFHALADGRADPSALVEALARAGAEHRLLLWNADGDDQAILAGTTIQGALPESDAAHSAIGVYLNDGTGSKMDYYLRPSIAAAWCSDATARVHVELRDEAPDPSALPPYVTGAGEHGVPVGETLTGVYVYLPPGAEVIDHRTASDDDSAPAFAAGTHDGRPVLKWSVRLSRGRSASLDLDVRMPWTPGLDIVATPTRDPHDAPRIGTCSGEGGVVHTDPW